MKSRCGWPIGFSPDSIGMPVVDAANAFSFSWLPSEWRVWGEGWGEVVTRMDWTGHCDRGGTEERGRRKECSRWN